MLLPIHIAAGGLAIVLGAVALSVKKGGTIGGLSTDSTQWIAPKNPAFLVPVQALSVIFRAKVCDGLRRAGLLDQAPPAV